MEKDANNRRPEKGMEIFSECLAAMLYSDEEIKATMASEDADEFIALRNNLFQSAGEGSVASYEEGDVELPMAAEDENACWATLLSFLQ